MSSFFNSEQIGSVSTTCNSFGSGDDAMLFGSSSGSSSSGSSSSGSWSISYSDGNQNHLSTGKWRVDRGSGFPIASASVLDTQNGATITELANEIGLRPDEYSKWLTIPGTVPVRDSSSGGGSSSITYKTLAQLKPDDVIVGGHVNVPNVIVMAWFGECTTYGKRWMRWGRNKKDLEWLGFRVITFDNDDYEKTAQDAQDAPKAFLLRLNNLSYLKQIHGLYMMGHGGKDVNGVEVIGSAGTKIYTKGPEWVLPYETIRGALANYKLGALIVHACDGDNTKAKEITSQHGDFVFYGKNNTFRPFIHFTGSNILPPIDIAESLTIERIAKHWGGPQTVLSLTPLEFGGKQKTRKFRSTFIPWFLD